MTRIRTALWSPAMLGGVLPGLLVLAVMATSLITQGFGLASASEAVRESHVLQDAGPQPDDWASSMAAELPALAWGTFLTSSEHVVEGGTEER